MSDAVRLISAFVFAFVTALVSAADVYADDSDKAGEPDIVGFASIEQGAWRTKIQQVFDPAVRKSETSRRVRLAQAPGGGLPGGADDIRVAITVDKRLPPSSRTGDPDLQKGDLWYSVSNAANALIIQPDNSRLMGMWKGRDEIALTQKEEEGRSFERFGVLSLVRSQLLPLNLIVQVQNRSSHPVQISGVYIQVDASVTDLQPAIQMSRQSAFSENADEQWYSPFYFVENFGLVGRQRSETAAEIRQRTYNHECGGAKPHVCYRRYRAQREN